MKRPADVNDSDLDQWFADRKMFFILGMGRSGTAFLAKLLDQADGALVYHEPIEEDFAAQAEAHASSQAARDYISGFRRRRMYELASPHQVDIYGEVNSLIRFHAGALEEAFPQARFVHIVRDGREVVRSIMARKHYTDSDEGHHQLSPGPGDPLYDQWDQLNRFEKICWLWTDANRRLRPEIAHRVKFERLVNDYGVFHEAVERYCGISVGEERWAQATRKPSNTTSNFSMPEWSDWDEATRTSFYRICGAEMEKCGYY